MAVHYRTGVQPLDQGVVWQKSAPAALVPARARDPRHHRVSPAVDPGGDRTDPRRFRRWRHADFARTRPGRTDQTRRNARAPEHVWYDRALSRLFRASLAER